MIETTIFYGMSLIAGTSLPTAGHSSANPSSLALKNVRVNETAECRRTTIATQLTICRSGGCEISLEVTKFDDFPSFFRCPRVYNINNLTDVQTNNLAAVNSDDNGPNRVSSENNAACRLPALPSSARQLSIFRVSYLHLITGQKSRKEKFPWTGE